MSFVITIGADNKSEIVAFVEDAPETLEANQYFVDDADVAEDANTARWIKVGSDVRPMTTAEFEAELAELGAASTAVSNRQIRDAKLAATDWMVIKAAEAGEAVAANVVSYRQALRDITSHTEWPHIDELDWPTL